MKVATLQVLLPGARRILLQSKECKLVLLVLCPSTALPPCKLGRLLATRKQQQMPVCKTHLLAMHHSI